MSTLIRLILAFMLVIFFGPASSNAQTDETAMMEQAKLQLSSGKLYFATSWLERILKTYPKTLKREEVLLLLSKAYAASGRDERAAKTLRTLLKEYPKAVVSLDPTLLKLADSIPLSESASTVIAIPSAPAAQAGKKPSSLPPPAEPAKTAATAATAVKIIPKSAAASALPATPAESTAKTVITPPTAAPATTIMEKTRLTKKPDKPAETVKDTQKTTATPLMQSTPTAIKPAVTAALVPKTAESAVKTVTILPTDVSATPNIEKSRLAGKSDRSTETARNVPKSSVTPAIQSTQTVIKPSATNVLRTSPAESTAKTNAIVPIVIPVTPNVPPPRLAEKADKSTENVTYTLDLGTYVDKSMMIDTMSKINKAGLSPLLDQGLKMDQTIIRLYAGEFSDQESARKVQEKLRAANVNSYIINDGSKIMHVCVGAYLDHDFASKELQRLSGLGINLSPKRVVVSLPTFLLTVGSYNSRETALEMARELKKQGVKSTVVIQMPMKGLTE
ncbi:MAG: hypothetical protein HGB32_11995 [Geobacteraceae bacterium]|nr:hypothetical protein [Geobacteraceae bacterium]NTW80848.1 hypothetical protein [Geobacteraceae bacterium]